MMLMMVMLFYGFAVVNGTLTLVAKHTTYCMRRVPGLLPIILWLLCIALSAAGVGPYGVFAIMGPTVMAIAKEVGIPRLLAAVIVISAGAIGAGSPVSTGGIVISNCAELIGYGSIAGNISNNVWLNLFIAQGLVFILVYIVMRGWRIDTSNLAKPDPMNENQKKTATIILIVLVLTFAPPILSALIDSEILRIITDSMNVTITCAIGVVLCMLFNVASEREAFKSMPWPTIILICGMSLLIGVAVSSGLVDQLSEWMMAHVENDGVIYLLLIISGVMSFFSSTLGVVVPTLSTLIPSFVAITGASPGFLFSIITISAMLAGYSPFSSAGGITLSGVSEEGERKRLYTVLLAASPTLVMFFVVLVFFGIIR
jgi:di/tricarboxylate transporter